MTKPAGPGTLMNSAPRIPRMLYNGGAFGPRTRGPKKRSQEEIAVTKAAQKALQRRAEAGDAEAQTALGDAYYWGQEGFSQDHIQAALWFRKAAEQGEAYSQDSLGWMYAQGEGGLPRDLDEAVRWYTRSAEQGFAVAQGALGEAYYRGKGVPQDHVQAALWFRRAAEQEEPHSQYSLGWMYAQGEGGLPQDIKEAVQWYTRSAKQGYEPAREALEKLSEDPGGLTLAHGGRLAFDDGLEGPVYGCTSTWVWITTHDKSNLDLHLRKKVDKTFLDGTLSIPQEIVSSKGARLGTGESREVSVLIGSRPFVASFRRAPRGEFGLRIREKDAARRALRNLFPETTAFLEKHPQRTQSAGYHHRMADSHADVEYADLKISANFDVFSFTKAKARPCPPRDRREE